MPTSRKPELYNLLKATGAPQSTSYTKYKIEDLERELTELNVDFSFVETPPAPVKEAMPPFRPRSFLTKLLPSR